MATTSAFYNLPLATLQQLQTQAINAVNDILVMGASATIGNRTYTLSDVDKVQKLLENINAAIDRVQGKRRKTVLANMNYRFPGNAAGMG